MKRIVVLLVVFALAMCGGCGLAEDDEMTHCEHCGESVREEHTFNHNGRLWCPVCVKEELVAPAEGIECWYCSEVVPKEYIFGDYSRKICPRCIYGDYRELTSDEVGKCYECNDFYYYSDSDVPGLCIDCGRLHQLNRAYGQD